MTFFPRSTLNYINFKHVSPRQDCVYWIISEHNLHKRCLQKERETVKRHLHFTLIPFFQIPFTLFSYSRIFDELEKYLNVAAKELIKNDTSVADNLRNYIGDALRQIVTEADNIGKVTILNSKFLYIYHSY